MGKQKFKFFAQRSGFGARVISLYAGHKERVNDSSVIFQPVILRQLTQEEEAFEHPPFLTIDEASAQDLFDELYTLGLRPSREEQVVDKHASAHIQDLRKIAFKLLKIEAM